ncbi:hypothetical protein Pcinc_033819 [Petrolisthes cinctipes]|uniref:Uncharacterized protein n=1 Tax=Petrolisthes cinctipes TaxID=88211 RepID=A0AAE1ERM0_PETCI|nr:hypothetical protein Pcinc_033819 [Petrolisthes cinctipes]
MSVVDFLQETVQEGAGEGRGDNYPTLGHPPRPLYHYPSTRRKWGRHRGRGSGRTEYKSAGTTTDLSSREVVRPGQVVTPAPHRTHPIIKKSPLTQPLESLLSVGSQEATRVKEGPEKSECDLEAMLTKETNPKLVLGESVEVTRDGEEHYYWPLKNFGEVARDTLLKVMVGLLNTGRRGTVFFGVGKGGLVEGVTAQPEVVGQFVGGLIKAAQFYLCPRLHQPQYAVRYNNVETTSRQRLDNVWVVELHTLPNMEHYYNAVTDMNYHIHHHGTTHTLSFTSFCHATVLHASHPYLAEVERAEAEVRELQGALERSGVPWKEAEGTHVCDKCYFSDCPAHCYGTPPVAAPTPTTQLDISHDYTQLIDDL